MTTTTAAPTIELQAEAQRIATANEGTITYHDADWTFFQIRHTVRGFDGDAKAEAVVTTSFEWNEYRFEGF